MTVGLAFLRSVPALFGVQCLQYVAPLLTMPFLIRVLGLEAWGELALLMVFGQLSSVALEYGFHVSATRSAARAKDFPETTAALFGAVAGAKLVIAALCLPLLFIVGALWLGPGQDHRLLIWALIAAAAQAHDPLWFFLGVGGAERIAAVTIAFRLAGVGVMFAFIRGPEDGWIYFAAQAAAWLCIAAYGVRRAYRRSRLSLKSLFAWREPTQSGWRFFVLYAGSMFFDLIVPLVLSRVCDPTQVGVFVAAERLTRSALGLLSPFRQAMFPHISAMIETSRPEAARLFCWAITRLGGLALAGGLVFAVAAVPVVRLLFGPDAAPVAEVLHILALFPLIVTLNGVIGVQWMIPCGLERRLGNIYVAAGVCRVGFCLALGAAYGAVGAGAAILLAEMLVLLLCLIFLRYRRLDPWRIA